MKNIFTFLGLFLAFTAFGQIQLDSIVVIDEGYQEETLQYNFTYNNGKLVTFGQEFDNELWITADIEYNNLDKMSMINLNFDDDLSVFTLSYNDAELLDTVLVEDQLDGNVMATFEYIDNVLSEYKYFQFIDEMPFEVANISYVYDGNIVTASTGGPFGGLVEEKVFDNQGRLVRWSELDSGSGLIDTFIYVDNCLEEANRKTTQGGEYSLAIDYTCDVALNFEQIPNPADFFVLIGYFVSDLTQHYYFPMLYGAKVDGSTGTYAFADETATWYYSLPTSTNERVVATPFSVYPNPTTDFIVMELEESLESFTIYDMNGSVVRSSIMNLEQIISVADLASGSYTIAANTKDDKYFFAQFVKE